MDAVTLFLQQQGKMVQPARLGKSAYLLGYQIEMYPYTVIYRVESGVLVLCSLTKANAASSNPAVLFQLRWLLKQMVTAIPVLEAIHMLIITDVVDPSAARCRRRILNWMLAYGAIPKQEKGELWLTLPVGK